MEIPAHKYRVLKFNEIIRVHVELTTRCNARCPMCMRNYRGLDFNSGYPLTELNLEQFQHILTPAVLEQLKPSPHQDLATSAVQFHGVIFNGNLGDFGLARDAGTIVRYLVDHGVAVKINTNGSLRTPEWWSQLAMPGVEIGWALDGLADTHGLYRQDTDWSRIVDNARAFIQAGGAAVWRFVPFDHNRHQEQACRDLAQQWGFQRFENIWDGRDRGPVYHRHGEFSHWIGARACNESSDPPPIQELLANHITWFDTQTVRTERDTPTLDMQCIHKRNREIYLAADGSVYPCCFLGFYPQTMCHPGNDQLRGMVRENNALEYSLAHCMQWFEAVEATWSQPSIAQGRLYQCINTCNRKSQ